MRRARGWRRALGAALFVTAGACVKDGSLPNKTYGLSIAIALPDGSALPGPNDEPFCLDLDGTNSTCKRGTTVLVSVEALTPTGARDTRFNGYVRVSIDPGTVVVVSGGQSLGRNILLKNGIAEAQTVTISNAFGPAHLLIEDVGYTPADPLDHTPQCADNVDNNHNGLVDYGADPGCYAANDDSEDVGTYATGVSAPLYYHLPAVAEVRGNTTTPFEQQGVSVDTSSKGVNVVVNRVSTSGFYVTDVGLATDPKTKALVATNKPYGGLYVFNFNTPGGVRVCDRITSLNGTMTEFFGEAELTAPSWDVRPWEGTAADGPCLVPEPVEVLGDAYAADHTPAMAQLQSATLSDDNALEQLESQLVRAVGGHVSANFGPALPQYKAVSGGTCATTYAFAFAAGASSCDFNNDGALDFSTACTLESQCSTQCYDDPECGEYTEYKTRGNFRLVLGAASSKTVLVNATAIPSFDPLDKVPVDATKGAALGPVYVPAVAGTLAHFSGGSQNWTIESRCADDLVACAPGEDAATCAKTPPTTVSSQKACVLLRTTADNDAQPN